MKSTYVLTTTALISIFSHSLLAENSDVLIRYFDAYNKADIAALKSTIHEDIREYTFPNKLKSATKAEMMNRWEEFITNAKPSVAVQYMSVIEDRIVTIELLRLTRSDGSIEEVEVAGIYEFKDGQIVKATFVD